MSVLVFVECTVQTFHLQTGMENKVKTHKSLLAEPVGLAPITPKLVIVQRRECLNQFPPRSIFSLVLTCGHFPPQRIVYCIRATCLAGRSNRLAGDLRKYNYISLCNRPFPNCIIFPSYLRTNLILELQPRIFHHWRMSLFIPIQNTW